MRQLYVYVANKSTQSLTSLTSLGTLQLQDGDKTLCVQIVIRMNCTKFNIQSDSSSVLGPVYMEMATPGRWGNPA